MHQPASHFPICPNEPIIQPEPAVLIPVASTTSWLLIPPAHVSQLLQGTRPRCELAKADSATFLQVSGDISLTCTWRVTPLDMAALKVKTRQSELDRKEEVLALLLERTGAPSPQISPMGPVGSLVEPGGTLAVVSSPPGGLAEQKRLMASRGALSLKASALSSA